MNRTLGKRLEAAADVDHFKPKSRYPEGVYEWSNWVLACPFCNQSKGEQWPRQGFVNPCDSSAARRPESYFAFDTLTGEILPAPGLQRNRDRRAVDTRDLVRLNSYHHLKRRVHRIELVRLALNTERREALIAEVMRPDRELYSITRQYLQEEGYVQAC